MKSQFYIHSSIIATHRCISKPVETHPRFTKVFNMLLSPVLTAIVFVVGLLIGSVGIGGALLVPALKYLGGIPLHSAVPACMFSYVVTGAAGAMVYARYGTINWPMALKLCFGALPGAYAGAFLLPYFSAAVLEGVIAVFILFAGVHALTRSDSVQRNQTGNGGHILVVTGLITGIGSALTGTGGPLLLIPILIWANLPVLTAIGLSQVVQIPISLTATLGNFIHGEVDFHLGLVLALTMAGGALAGAGLVHRLPVGPLKKIVAILLVAVGLLMLSGFSDIAGRH